MQIIEHTTANETEIQKVVDGINNHAIESGFKPTEYLGTSIVDENSKTIASLFGAAVFGSLWIDGVWVHEDHRGQGHGRVLMEKIEKMGKQKGCKFACLYTLDFQGLEFYQKLGYKIEFERPGYQNDAKAYHLIKSL